MIARIARAALFAAGAPFALVALGAWLAVLRAATWLRPTPDPRQETPT